MLGLWSLFLLVIVLLLALDLGVLNRKAHVIGFAEALRWSLFWIVLALLFNVLVWFIYDRHWFGAGLEPDFDGPLTGTGAALKFLNGYLLEKSLSVDNIFVIAMVMRGFGVAPAYQHRVLFWGILGALVTRGIFIGMGAFLVRTFAWTFYLFGALLLWAGLKMLRENEEDAERKAGTGSSWVIRFVRRFVPIQEGDPQGRFFVREKGRLAATTLLPALLVIEATDVMFAVDSVPAIFGITADPFLVFTSNIFAILGLRALFFVLADSIQRFRYLKTAVAAIILFIGVKMLLHGVLAVPLWVSLGVVFLALGAGIVASLVADRPARTSEPPR
jgi:tellurite resistance protein TerC